MTDDDFDVITITPLFTAEDLVSEYTRAEAIADGVLIDVSEAAREVGIIFPVALTRAAYEDCVAWTDEDGERRRIYQDERGRLHDVVWMLRLAVGRSRGGSEVVYEIVRIEREGTVLIIPTRIVSVGPVPQEILDLVD